MVLRTLSRRSTIVSTTWLRDKICTGPKEPESCTSVRILDTSWLPEPDVDGYSMFYREAHIPTAGYFDLKEITPKTTTERFPIPDSNVFQEHVEELGISNDTHVIAYDRFNTRPSFRTWFLFRLFGHDKISVLSGGMRQWIQDGFHVTTHEPNFETGTFQVNFRPSLLHNYNDMLNIVSSDKRKQIVDARGAASFWGEKEDKSGGHITGAKNIPFKTLFNEDGTVKSNKDLQELFNMAGIDLHKPLVSSCQSGMTACGLIAAAFLLGKEDVPLYNGSFFEWGAKADKEYIVRSDDK